MKQLPKVNASFENLYGILIAPIRSKLLLTGIELRVFNHLTEPGIVETVSTAIGTQPENTRLFLDGLAACDLVIKKDSTYRNTTIAQEFLVEGSQTYLGELFTSQTQMSMYAGLDDLPELVREGLTNERTKPDVMVLSMISLSLMGQDMCFDQGEIADSMLRVGFRSIRSHALETDWGPMDLDIGRKA